MNWDCVWVSFHVCFHCSSSWTWHLLLSFNLFLCYAYWYMYILLFPSFPSLLLYILRFSIFSPSFCSNLSFLFHLFYISLLFSPPLSSPAPSILLHTGGESAVPTEQHWCSGQRHVSALRQPCYCVSLWGRDLGQEAPAQNRTGSQTHVQGKAGEYDGFVMQLTRGKVLLLCDCVWKISIHPFSSTYPGHGGSRLSKVPPPQQLFPAAPGDPEAFPGQMRNLMPAAHFGSALGSPTCWTCLENLQRKEDRKTS